jgi:hypothetical protein
MQYYDEFGAPLYQNDNGSFFVVDNQLPSNAPENIRPDVRAAVLAQGDADQIQRYLAAGLIEWTPAQIARYKADPRTPWPVDPRYALNNPFRGDEAHAGLYSVGDRWFGGQAFWTNNDSSGWDRALQNVAEGLVGAGVIVGAAAGGAAAFEGAAVAEGGAAVEGSAAVSEAAVSDAALTDALTQAPALDSAAGGAVSESAASDAALTSSLTEAPALDSAAGGAFEPAMPAATPIEGTVPVEDLATQAEASTKTLTDGAFTMQNVKSALSTASAIKSAIALLSKSATPAAAAARQTLVAAGARLQAATDHAAAVAPGTFDAAQFGGQSALISFGLFTTLALGVIDHVSRRK